MSEALIQVKERPILFSGPMVRAILEGRKTQTRRICKAQPRGNYKPYQYGIAEWGNGKGRWGCEFYDGAHEAVFTPCPYGQPGDRLWVRETWCWSGGKKERLEFDPAYRADGFASQDGWRPSIHMPRWASRINLEIIEVRVERLQDISDDDAEAEGIKQEWTCINPGTGSYAHLNDVRDDYRKLWESINGAGSWGRNEWVWVISFNRIKP